jgi:hypothetical protein
MTRLTRTERKARADAERAAALARFEQMRCDVCGAQATVFVIGSVDRKSVTRKYCMEHWPR